MTKEEIKTGAESLISGLSGSDKDKRAVLRAALHTVQVKRLTDAEISALFVPGVAFATRKMAESIGVTPRRVAKLAEAHGCTKVTSGVYQAPAQAAQ